MGQQSIDFGMQYTPQLNQFNMSQLQGMLNQALPGYQGMVNQMATNTSSLLQGQIPDDVKNLIQRQSAQQTFTSGIGGGGLGTTLTGNAATARSLGLTSLGLQEQGGTQLNNLLGLTRNYLMPQPVNPLSLLPLNDLVAGQQWTKEAQYQASLAAYTAKANAAAARVGAPTNPIAGVAGALQGLNQSFGQVNPQTGQTGYQTIGNLFGGGQSGMGATAAGSSGMSGTAGPGSSFTNADLFSAAYG